MPAKKPLLLNEPLEPLIFSIRGHRVMLDADLARLYGVTTKALNQAVKRNSSRFPRDFAFQLTKEDVMNWSQFAPQVCKTVIRKEIFQTGHKL